jgi:hypothetical protein
LRAALQAEQPGAVDAGRQRQRHLRPCGLVDRPLQDFGLIIGTAGTDAILRGVAAEHRGGLSRTGAVGRHRQRAGKSGGGNAHELAAFDIHD